MEARHLVEPYTNLTIDAHPPQVTFICGPTPGSVRPTDNDTVCASCGTATDEAALGCTLYYQVIGPEGPGSGVDRVCPALPGSNTACAASFLFQHLDRPDMVWWAVDGAGNVGPTTRLTWTVDSLIPVTLWPAFTYGRPLSNVPAPEFELSCNRAGCRFSYILNGGALTVVGSNSSAASPDAGPSANGTSTGGAVLGTGEGMDTRAVMGVRRISNATACLVNLTAVVNGTAVAVNATAPSLVTLQLRLDGAVAWQDVHTLHGLSDGAHSLHVRSVHGVVGADSTPATLSWFLSRQPPTVSAVRGPPEWSSTPSAGAVFVLRASIALHTTSLWYQLWSVGDSPATVLGACHVQCYGRACCD